MRIPCLSRSLPLTNRIKSIVFRRAGHRDVINGAVLDDKAELAVEAVDGSCTSAQFKLSPHLGTLALPWMVANPLTGSPWKRRCSTIYPDSDA